MIREILAKFGVQFDTHELKAGHDKVQETIDGLKHLAHAAAGVFALHQIEAFVDRVSEEAAALRRSSTMLGINAQELQRLQFAADQAGTSAESLTMGLRFLQRNAFEAGRKGGEAGKYFKTLGITVKDASGHVKPTTELLEEVSTAISGMADPAEQTATAMRLFGRGGAEMLPFLKQGPEGLEKVKELFHELGGGYSSPFLELTKKFRAHEKQLALLKKSISSQLGLQAIPGLMRLGTVIEHLGLAFLKANKNEEMMRLAVAAFALMAAAKLPGVIVLLKHMNWQLYLSVAKFLALYLVADDLITWFQGGESVIGKFFGAFAPGVNTAAEALGSFFSMLTSSWDNFMRGVEVIPSAIGMAVTMAFNEAAQGVGYLIAWVFDQWDRLVKSLKLPGWAESLLGTSHVGDQSGEGNRKESSAEWDRSRADLGQQFLGEQQDSSWQRFQEALDRKQKTDKAEQGWGSSNGQMGKFAWDMTKNAPTQLAQTAVPQALARPTTQVNDSSHTEIHVTVPGTTPANIAQKTATATARAARNGHNASLYSLEPVVE